MTLTQDLRIEFEDIFVPVQGGTVADAVLSIEHVDGLETFPDIVPVTNFVKDYLTTYPNLNDFYQNISTNLAETIVNNASFLGLAGTLDTVSVELLREPVGVLPHPFFSEAIQSVTESSEQLLTIKIEDIFIPVQGGTVADATLKIDHIDDLVTFPDIVPVTNFLKDYLTTYPNPDDFYQDISTNLAQTIINNAENLGLAGTLDNISVELRRGPANVLPHPFFSESTVTPSGNLDNNLRIEVEDIFIPVQGGTVADMTLEIDHVDGLTIFPDIIPVTEFAKAYLTNYPNPDDFYQDITSNLSQEIINNAENLGLAGTLDAVSVELIREPVGVLPNPFSSEAINTSTGDTDQRLNIFIEDIFVPVQGGTVADANVSIDHVNGLTTFPDIVPLTNFVNDYLTNYPNPNDFYQDINTNLTQEILNNADILGLAGTLEAVSVELRRGPANVLPHPFFSQSTSTSILDSSFDLQGNSVETSLMPDFSANNTLL